MLAEVRIGMRVLKKEDVERAIAGRDPAPFVFLGTELHMVTHEVCADLLELPKGAVSSDIFNAFVYLRELGHAHDYFIFYQTYPEYRHLPDKEVMEIWKTDIDDEHAELPVPEMSGRVLAEDIVASGGYTAFVDKHVQRKKRFAMRGITDEESLMRIQKESYWQMPREHYANRFAVEFMKKHWQELFVKTKKAA